MKKEILKKLIEKPISGEWGEEGDVVSVIRTTNFNNDGTLNLSDVVRRNIIEKKVIEKSLKTGDIIVEKSGGSPTQPVGRVVFFDQKGTYLCNNFTSILRPKKEIVFPKYLHYLLFANHKFGKTERFQNKTTGIINLQLQRFIEEIQIPLPPLETQQRIAAILDQADALRKKTQQLIDSYDELAQSIFLDMFGDPVVNPKGWKEKKIIEVCDHPKDIKCGPFGTQLQKSEYQDNGIPLWGIPQINSNFEKYPKEYVSIEKARQLDQYSVKPFDILMSRKGNVGKCAVYPSHFEDGIMHSDVLRLRCGTKLSNPIFIAYQFKLNRKLITHVEQVSSGAIMAGINVSRLKDIFVQVPPISLQNQFAQKIDLIEQQKELTKQSLKESEDLFNTLLQKAFKGELEL